MTWLQTASGSAFDLLDPRPEDVHFAVDVAEALARIARFTGHVRSGPYSVAQHSVIGADALFAETHRPELAAAYLLHDAHEAYVGDIATPIAQALAQWALAAMMCGDTAVRDGLRDLKARIDKAIHRAAGMAWPLPAEIRAKVKLMDLRMLATERRHLLGPSPMPWAVAIETAEPVPLRGKLTVWPWPKAAEEYRIRLTRYCPAALDRAA